MGLVLCADRKARDLLCIPLIISYAFEGHLQRLREVFVRLRKVCHRLKPKKCLLLRPGAPCMSYWEVAGNYIEAKEPLVSCKS